MVRRLTDAPFPFVIGHRENQLGRAASGRHGPVTRHVWKPAPHQVPREIDRVTSKWSLSSALPGELLLIEE